MPKCFVRKIESFDLQSISGLDAICFPESYWKLSDFSSVFESGGFGFLIEDTGIVLGFVFAQTLDDQTEIFRLGVLSAFRHHGYAERLLSVLEQKTSPHTLFLEVRASNGAAQSLYLKRGFTQIAERENYYSFPSENAIVLSKKI